MTSKFKVEDMHCAHCEASVKEAVSALSGVKEVKVSLPDKTCTVEFDEAVLKDADICSAIDAVGFEAVKM